MCSCLAYKQIHTNVYLRNNFLFQTMYSEDNASMPDGIDKNVYVPTGFYKVRLHFIFLFERTIFNLARTYGASSIYIISEI